MNIVKLNRVDWKHDLPNLSIEPMGEIFINRDAIVSLQRDQTFEFTRIFMTLPAIVYLVAETPDKILMMATYRPI